MENIMGHLNHFMQEIQQYIAIIYLWSALVPSPPDRPHLIMLFCFLISRNAKCLCHLWTAKRANLGFPLIATVTSLLRLHRGADGRVGGWERMAGGGLDEGWRDGRMETQLSSHTAEVWKNAAGQQNAAWRSPTAGSGEDSLGCERAPTPSREGGGFSSGQLCSLNFAGEATVLSRAIAGRLPDRDTYLLPTWLKWAQAPNPLFYYSLSRHNYFYLKFDRRMRI